MEVDRSVLDDFVAEADEHLQTMDEDILSLENNGGNPDPELIGRVFRAVHSIKGAAGFLGLTAMNALSHTMENILSKIREGEITPDSTHTSALLAGIDHLRAMLHQIDESNSMDIGAVHERLMGLLNKDHGEMTAPPETPHISQAPAAGMGEAPGELSPSPGQGEEYYEEDACDAEPPQFAITAGMGERFAMEADELLENVEQCLLALKENPSNAKDLVAESFRAVHSFKGNSGFMELADLQRLSHKMEEVFECLKAGEVEYASVGGVLLQMVDILREGVADVSKGGKGTIDGCDLLVEFLEDLIPAQAASSASPPPPSIEPPPQSPAPPERATEAAPAVRAESKPGSACPPPKEAEGRSPKASSGLVRRDLRVDLEKLDALVNLVGELVIAEAMVTRNNDLAGLELENFDRAAHHMRRIITDIQDVAMAVRMIPLSSTFRKMIRLVYDLAGKQGKSARLELVGEETEVDKTVIEMIADPLVHIVRNAIDHGIEGRAERLAAGKPEMGTISIEARHEGGEVLILIKDDGRGLSREKILAKAIERGLVAGNGNDMSDSQVFQLIFEAGLSTAAAVTDVSGRGVGMDVVKKNIEKLKGRVDIHSKLGEGSVIVLRLPLTLAIMEGMLIRVGSARYTLPILTIRETFQPVRKQITVTMDGQEVVNIRKEIIPVVRLHELFNKKPDHLDLEEGILLIVDNSRGRVCLFADEILGQYQTVIKGLPDYIENVNGISGCTILGNGEVSLILDVAGIMNRAGKAF